MKNIKIDSRSILIALLVIIILIATGGVYFAASTLIQAKQQSSDLLTQIQSERAKLGSIPQNRIAFEQVSSEGFVDEFPTMLPDEPEFIDLVIELETIADDAGGELIKQLGDAKLTINGVEVDDPEDARALGSSDVVLKGDGYAIIQFVGTYRTDFPGVIEFLRYINDTKYFLNVDSIDVTRVEIDDGDDLVDVEIIVNAYIKEIIGL